MDTKNQVIELVVYRLNTDPSAHRAILIEQTNQGLAQLAGYQSRKVYQATDDPHLLVDYVAWDTLENALDAAANMSKVPELVNFMKLIDSVVMMKHFTEFV
ncbi:hypothetical protein [Spirosoma arcticum]